MARRLAQVWGDSAKWTLRCRSIRVDGFAERLVDLLSSTNGNMLDEIWEFGHTLLPRIEDAISSSIPGGSTHIDLTLTLTVDLDEYNEEFSRFESEVMDRIERGLLP